MTGDGVAGTCFGVECLTGITWDMTLIAIFTTPWTHTNTSAVHHNGVTSAVVGVFGGHFAWCGRCDESGEECKLEDEEGDDEG